MSLAVASWSGGKDSCFACYKAMLSGLKVSYLLNLVLKDGRSIPHGLNPKLMITQSQAIEIPIIQREVTWETYEYEFKTVVCELKQMGVNNVVFGDIDVQEHKDWVNRVCTEIGVTPIEPLWSLDPEQILIDFISEGFEAIVVNVKADLFGEEWLGRKVDQSFLRDLKELQSKYNFNICGELGEYHTLVIDGPIFKRRIKILDGRRVLREGYWKFWLLDILKYEVEDKITA